MSEEPEKTPVKLSSQRRWNDAHPLERWAHAAVASAVRRGLLIAECCEVCGSTEAEAHHDDYRRPIDVRWLCRLHHRHVHRRPKGGG